MLISVFKSKTMLQNRTSYMKIHPKIYYVISQKIFLYLYNSTLIYINDTIEAYYYVDINLLKLGHSFLK